MDINKAKCPECKLLFETSFESTIKVKTCPCCEYIGPVEKFMCKEEDWHKKEFKKSFLSSFKKKEAPKDSNLKHVKKFSLRKGGDPEVSGT